MTRSPLVVLLVVVHAIVGLWAVVGLLEWGFAVPWPRITNPDLSGGLLLVHWLAMAAMAAVFFVGLALRSPATPHRMLAAYVGLALICAYETFFVLHSRYRFLSMALEYLAYASLAALWLRASALRHLFRLETRPT